MLKRAIFLCIGLYSMLLLNRLERIESSPVDERTFSNAMDRLERSIDSVKSSVDSVEDSIGIINANLPY